MIKYIVLSLGDNDFGSVLKGFMNGLKDILEYDPKISKKKMEKLIWEGLMFYIMAYCAHYVNFNEDEYKRLKSYFEKNMKIVFNEEAFLLASTSDHDGGSYYLDVINGQIGSF